MKLTGGPSGQSGLQNRFSIGCNSQASLLLRRISVQELTESCFLCKGSGKVTHPVRTDEKGSFISLSETKDEWLEELTKYCKDNPKANIPVAYAEVLLKEIWQLTYIIYAKEKM
jgi:hypothetical protein